MLNEAVFASEKLLRGVTLTVLEGVHERLKLSFTHADTVSGPSPVVHGLHNFTQYLLGTRARDAEISNHGHKGVDGHVVACVLG